VFKHAGSLFFSENEKFGVMLVKRMEQKIYDYCISFSKFGKQRNLIIKKVDAYLFIYCSFERNIPRLNNVAIFIRTLHILSVFNLWRIVRKTNISRACVSKFVREIPIRFLV
jgi:hypothetical protein